MYDDLKPSGLLSTAKVFLTYKDPGASATIIDDYQTNPASGTSSSGGGVTFDVSNLTEGALDGNNNFCQDDAMNGMQQMSGGDVPQNGVVFDWTVGQQKFYEFAVVGGQQDMRNREFLALRACQGTHHAETLALSGPLYISVELRDGAGHTSTVNTQAYGGISRPYQRTGGCGSSPSEPGWLNQHHTVRIRLADFENDNSQLDLANVVAVRLELGSASGSSRGRMGLDQVQLENE
jgi:hypothetical protein